MYQQFIPQGPTPTPPATIIDRTAIFDPAEFWPNAMDCPDWPHLTGNLRYDGPRGKVGAEGRLQNIGAYLNRGRELRKPSEEERAQEVARLFRRSGGHWYALGITNLSPAGVLAETEACLIVEACHLRGYLRKLEAQAVQAEEAKARRKLADARHTLAQYRATVPAEVEEIKALSEAVARHKQRLEDERAVARSQMLRDHVATMLSAAVSAAHTLGEEAPAHPAFD
ncbi:hypothetical protein ACFOKF_06000 [Sphingobium rhizovicinum]|uniref:Uncharacterized protein n=1 Tax=Sphingobium rhizovicinum TaxID=432308 RepID=A0ABV7NF44_9SPHN